MFTPILPLKIYCFFGPGGDFLKRHLDSRFKVVSAGSLPGASASAAAKRSAENVVEHREDVRDIHVRKIMLAGNALVSKLIVSLALSRVGEHFVRLGAFLEFDLRRGFVPVRPIRMKLHRLPPIRALDLLSFSSPLNAQDFVIIALCGRHSFSYLFAPENTCTAKPERLPPINS
jgi:hypothetical protein